MQTGKKAVESVKETAANLAATSRSGMEKTKATLQGTGEKMTAHNDADKMMAEQRKAERVEAAEINKQEAHCQNAAQRAANAATAGTPGHQSYSTTGEPGYTAGPNQMSALPGHGTWVPTGRVVEGTVKSHPIGTATGTNMTTRSTTAHNTRAGAGAGGTTGYGTGGGYTG